MASAAPLSMSQLDNQDDLDARIARLSDGQRDVLERVNRHHSSKEIAAEFGISPHTVDQRIRQALHILNVERRTEAARLVASRGGFDDAYQRLIHQPPYIDPSPAPPQIDAAISHQIRHADRTGGTGPGNVITEQTASVHRSSLSLPFTTRSQPRNELSVGQRLLWIMIISIGATFSAGMYLAGLESLSRMLNS